MINVKPTLGILISLWLGVTHAQDLCLDNVCIGDDVETLPVKWKPIELTYADQRFVETALQDRAIEDVYYDYNEQLVAEKNILRQILPYVIQKQRFDSNVLGALSKVQAICSSLTLTGELDQESEDRLYVTFRAVADSGKRGKLRVVRIEKQYNVMAPHLRPADADTYRRMKTQLKERFPTMAVVRDIDGRANSSAMQSANALLGFRFISDVSNPLVLRLIDAADLEMIEESEQASAYCRR